MRVILVRHGETSWNEAGRYQGWEDPPLSPRGRRTAQRIGALLRDRGLAGCTLWSSDLRRASETARLALGREPRIDSRLRELDFGEFAGRTYEQNLTLFGPRFAAWVEHRGVPAPPGGESLADFYGRTAAWLSEARRTTADSETVVVVTHGGVIRALLRPFESVEIWPSNGDLVAVTWDGRGPPAIERWALIREDG